MSSMPPQFPGSDQVPVVDYAPPQDVRNGMAIASLVLGIIGLATCPIIGIIALILGIIALIRAHGDPATYKGRGMAVAGICCGGVSLLFIPLIISILLPSLSRAREITKRAVCSSNLRGIGQGMKVYANDNLDWYPISPYAQPPDDGAVNATGVRFIGQMSANLTEPLNQENWDAVHPSRSLFMLILDSTCSPGQFICPGSDDLEDDLRNYTGGSGMGSAAMLGVDRFDFRGYPYLSYGCQLPYGQRGRPNEMLDNRMVILADKGPYFEAGQPVNNGERTPDAAKGSPGAAISLPGATTETQLLQLANDRWRDYNSRNHGGEGQNMLFQDGHVAFMKRPIAGVNFDNVYTMQGSTYTLLDSLLGRQPADFLGPFTNTDSVIVP